MATPNPQQNLPASSIGTSFQMRSELLTVPNTMVDVLQSTETDLATAGNFKLTTELLEKALRTHCAYTCLWLLPHSFLKVKNLVTSKLLTRHTSNSLRMPRSSDALATPTGFAFAIQQLGTMNISDTLNETIYIPCFPNEGHSFGIPDLRCEIAFQEFSNTQPLQRRCWDSKSFNIVFNTVGSFDRILNDVPTKDRVYSSGLSLRGTLEGAEPIEEACRYVCYWFLGSPSRCQSSPWPWSGPGAHDLSNLDYVIERYVVVVLNVLTLLAVALGLLEGTNDTFALRF
nr:putative coat protein [Ipomoea batatas]